MGVVAFHAGLVVAGPCLKLQEVITFLTVSPPPEPTALTLFLGRTKWSSDQREMPVDVLVARIGRRRQGLLGFRGQVVLSQSSQSAVSISSSTAPTTRNPIRSSTGRDSSDA
jgi:hypothetical protein